MRFALFLNGRAHVGGAASSCYAAAFALGVATEVATPLGKMLKPLSGAAVLPCETHGDPLACDGQTLADGSPLPPLPIARRAA